MMEATARHNILNSVIYKRNKGLPLSVYDGRKPLCQAASTPLSIGNRARTAYLHCIKDGKNIDPPYNTGNDFVYKDDFSDNIGNYKQITGQVDDEGRSNSSNPETSGRFHTDWLNMIYPRLRLARNLLSEDGVIFISIDDNEVDNLKKISDEIFGEINFISHFIRKSGISARLDAKNISKETDFILMYCKDETKLVLNQQILDNDDSYSLEDEYVEKRGKYKLNKLDRGSIQYSKSLDYYIEAPDGTKIYPGGTMENNGWCWRWSQDKVKWGLKNGFIVIKEGRNGWSVYFKQYQYVNNNDEKINRAIPFKNLLADSYFNENGSKLIKTIFDNNLFDYPKPIELLIHLLKISINRSDSIILDFFSGSATTAHAVMQLNAEDGGNRKFIMVQLPEPTPENSEAHKAGYKNICEIGKERIRRAGEMIKTETGKDDLDIGFKVFKLDSSNIRKWQPDTENLKMSLSDFIDNYVEGRTEQDVVYEIILKMGLELTVPVEEYEFNGKKVYSAGFGALMICVDDDITEDVSKGMVELYRKLKPEVWKVVFKDNGFATDSVKTNVRENLKTAGLAEESFTTL